VRDQVLRLPPTPNARKIDQTLWVLFTPYSFMSSFLFLWRDAKLFMLDVFF
jgi:hypothetical protein